MKVVKVLNLIKLYKTQVILGVLLVGLTIFSGVAYKSLVLQNNKEAGQKEQKENVLGQTTATPLKGTYDFNTTPSTNPKPTYFVTAKGTNSPAPSITNSPSGNSPSSSNNSSDNSNQSQTNSATPTPTPTPTPEPTQTPTPTPDSTPLTAEITTCTRNGDTAIVTVTANKPIKWCSVGFGNNGIMTLGADISDPNGTSCSREFSAFQTNSDVKVYYETCAASVKSFNDEVVSLNKQVMVQ